MKKILIVMCLLSCFSINAFAQKQQMAVVSFTGSKLSSDEASGLIDLFIGELTKSEYRNDFTLLARNESALRTAYGELNFQRDSMLDESQMGEIGKELGAGWVFYGTVSSFGGNSITINILDVETKRIVATANRRFSNLHQVTEGGNATDMVKELISKVRGERFVSRQEAMQRQQTSNYGDEYKTVTTLKMVGRGLWIGGATFMLGAVVLDLAISDMGLFGFMIYPTESEVYAQYGSYSAYYDATGTYNSYYDWSKPTLNAFFWGGLVLVAAGVTMDIIFSMKESEAERALNYAFIPYINPEMDMYGNFNGNVDLGMQFAFSYKF